MPMCRDFSLQWLEEEYHKSVLTCQVRVPSPRAESAEDARGRAVPQARENVWETVPVPG